MTDPKNKSPLEGLKKAVESGKARLPTAKEFMEARKAQEQDDEDRKMKRGKHAPPNGVCVVCSGEVIAKVTHEYFGDPMHRIIGPGSQNRRVHHGWHCIGCGLRYEFSPKGPPARL